MRQGYGRTPTTTRLHATLSRVLPCRPELPRVGSDQTVHTRSIPPGGLECLSDIAAHLGVTKDTVYTWIAEKDMPAHKVGRLWKFQASEIDEWVRRGGAAARDDTEPD